MPTSAPTIDQRLVSLTRPESLEADQYQALRLSLQRLKAARDVSMIAMTSPTTGDGKTLTAINLAGALAGVGSRVLLIEADLRRPSVADQLGIRGDTAPGLADLVLDPALMMQDALLPLNLGFDVITAGSPSAVVRDVFNSPRLEMVLR